MLIGQAPPAPAGALERLLPYGLGFAVILILLWLVKSFAGEWVKKAAERSFTRAFPGRGRVGGRKLRSYRQAVEGNYGKHALGFFRTQPIDIRTVYVPLQYEGGERRGDVYERIRAEPRSVVLGPAGAGKSLLLKHSMLIWAAEPLPRRPHVPVLVDLHRCNTSDQGLVELVVDELRSNRLHRRRQAVAEFVRHALDEGRLRLLFDGLDEVGRDNQNRVVRDLRDLAKSYPDCQIVVTCRSAVYHGQLAPEFGHVVHVAEFDDASVRRLLGNWPGIDGAGGADRLFDMIRKNPPLMRLARSPLLLTMMAYLHVEGFAKTGRTLPSSRAEFYEKAITHLLGRDVDLGREQSLTVYHVGEKLAALQRIALALQETPPDESADRLSMTRPGLLSAIGQTLPELNLDAQHGKPLLDEIVDRSQLLVPLDRSNWRYQFRHLTMQEYLAARELASDPDRLMANYRADPDAWRETVKLWCADGRDCTAVVAEVFAADKLRHKVLALECLADAKRISVDLADRVIKHFIGRLDTSGSYREREAIVRAFGAVAAESRPRGNKVLEQLITIAQEHRSHARAAALRVLAVSGRVEAAQALAPLAPHHPGARAALRDMGELAIPVLAEQASGGALWAVDDLAVIATPAAAESLAQLLWSTEPATATRASWWLAELLRNPDIEDALSRTQISPPRAGLGYEWVWQPFAAQSSPTMTKIASGIAFWLDNGDPDVIPRGVASIDSRIALPVAVSDFHGSTSSIPELPPETVKLAADFAGLAGYRIWHVDNAGTAFLHEDDRAQPGLASSILADSLLSQLVSGLRSRRMIELLDWPVRATILRLLLKRRMPDDERSIKREWARVTEVQRSSRMLWWVAGAIAGLVSLVACGIAAYRNVVTITGFWSFGPEWLAWVSLAGLAVLGGRALSILLNKLVLDSFVLYIIGVSGVIQWISNIALGYGMVLAMITATTWIGWPAVAAILGSLASVVAVLVWSARRRDRANANPLRQCLLADRRGWLGRRSVIAATDVR